MLWRMDGGFRTRRLTINCQRVYTPYLACESRPHWWAQSVAGASLRWRNQPSTPLRPQSIFSASPVRPARTYRPFFFRSFCFFGGARIPVLIIGSSPNFSSFGHHNSMGSTACHPAKKLLLPVYVRFQNKNRKAGRESSTNAQ